MLNCTIVSLVLPVLFYGTYLYLLVSRIAFNALPPPPPTARHNANAFASGFGLLPVPLQPRCNWRYCLAIYCGWLPHRRQRPNGNRQRGQRLPSGRTYTYVYYFRTFWFFAVSVLRDPSPLPACGTHDPHCGSAWAPYHPPAHALPWMVARLIATFFPVPPCGANATTDLQHTRFVLPIPVLTGRSLRSVPERVTRFSVGFSPPPLPPTLLRSLPDCRVTALPALCPTARSAVHHAAALRGRPLWLKLPCGGSVLLPSPRVRLPTDSLTPVRLLYPLPYAPLPQHLYPAVSGGSVHNRNAPSYARRAFYRVLPATAPPAAPGYHATRITWRVCEHQFDYCRRQY